MSLYYRYAQFPTQIFFLIQQIFTHERKAECRYIINIHNFQPKPVSVQLWCNSLRNVVTCGYKMEPEKELVSTFIFLRFKLGDEPIQIHSDLTCVHGESRVPRCIICRWVQRYKGATGFNVIKVQLGSTLLRCNWVQRYKGATGFNVIKVQLGSTL